MRYMHFLVPSCLVFFVSAVLSAVPAAPAATLINARVSKVIDGDTIRVWLHGKEETIRYIAVEAPELRDPGGIASRQAHEKLIATGQVWLEFDRNAQEQPKRDTHGRLLAYAFADKAGKQCLNRELVELGAARVGIRAVKDDTPKNAFAVKRLDELVAAQIKAASSHAGWWGKDDPYATSDFIVCFIKFWGKDEVAWLLNRGTTAIDLTLAWQLSDQNEKNSVILAQRVPTQKLWLPAGAICCVHTGPGSKLAGVQADTNAVDMRWKRVRVWNNTGDQATLRDPNGMVIYTYTYRASGN